MRRSAVSLVLLAHTLPLLHSSSHDDGGVHTTSRYVPGRMPVLWNEFWLQDCNASSFPLGSFGIDANARNDQNGATITILGAGSIQGQHHTGPFMDWPKIETDGTMKNGGLPARADNLSAVMARIEAALKALPDGFSGGLYFDMEAWDPLWEITASQYRNASVAWVLQRKPGLSVAAATAQAKREYEAAAKRWLLAPLEAALRMYPRALVGYYNYPKCASGMDCEQMPPGTNIPSMNDRLAWLWNASSALFPTIYYDFVWHKGAGPIIRESRRLAGPQSIPSSKKVLPVWWYYGCGSYSKFCSEANQRKQWEQAVAAGCDGFVVWGGGKATPEGCRTFEIYVSTVLGPVARNVTKRRVTSSASGSVLSSGPHRYVGNLPGILPAETMPPVKFDDNAELTSLARREGKPNTVKTLEVHSNGRCGALGILPQVQQCVATVPLQVARLTAGWVIAARTTDSATLFVATELQQNLSATHGIHLNVIDTASLATSGRQKYIAVGVLKTDPSLTAVAREAGLNTTAATLATIAPEGYHLIVGVEAIFLLGSAPAGAFYGVQSFMQMTEATGPSAVPVVEIQDFPDTPVRGAEIEQGPGGSDWWKLVARTMARMKLNMLGPDSMTIPFGFDSVTKKILMPDPKAVASIRALQSYFADRFIDIALIINAPKMDPRILEGKWVRDEPFTFHNGTAVATIPSTTDNPANGDFDLVKADGTTPVGWTFDRPIGGPDTAPPCRLDRHNSASGTGNSVVCDVQVYPMPCPYSPAECKASVGPHQSAVLSATHARSKTRSEPMHYNTSGPLSSDVFSILPGSMYVISFAASWQGNWSGSFTASVSLYQYESADQATANENPSNPTFPYSVNFIPCAGGDARHCTVWHESSGIPQLPEWGRFSTNFMTAPTSKFLRIRSYISGWGAGQWWVDSFKIARVDGELKNVIITHNAKLNISSTECGESQVCEAGRDFAFEPQPLDPMGNFSKLQPLQVRRVASSRLRSNSRMNLSYNVLPGAANMMVGSRDVACYAEPLYAQHMEEMIEFAVQAFGRITTSSDKKEMRFLDADGFDEQMGMGRDSRTLSSDLTNGQILGRAMNSLQAMIATSSRRQGLRDTPTLAIWADLVVKDHNGGRNYSYLAGAGRQQPYWPAIELLDRRILLFSWIYTTTSYDRKLIRDDPHWFQSRNQSWVGCPWVDLDNVKLWQAAVRDARRSQGRSSAAQGMMCTNWGGGRFEAGLLPTARAAWNLADPLDPNHPDALA